MIKIEELRTREKIDKIKFKNYLIGMNARIKSIIKNDPTFISSEKTKKVDDTLKSITVKIGKYDKLISKTKSAKLKLQTTIEKLDQIIQKDCKEISEKINKKKGSKK
jgi:hypothetical protein